MAVHLADDVPMATEGSNEVVTAKTSWKVSRKGEGWHAISLRLYIVDADDDAEDVNACEDSKRRLTSYSQSVVFVGGGAPDPDKKAKG